MQPPRPRSLRESPLPTGEGKTDPLPRGRGDSRKARAGEGEPPSTTECPTPPCADDQDRGDVGAFGHYFENHHRATLTGIATMPARAPHFPQKCADLSILVRGEASITDTDILLSSNDWMSAWLLPSTCAVAVLLSYERIVTFGPRNLPFFDIFTPSSPQTAQTDNDYPSAPVTPRDDIAR